jgi:hypothetical protein
VGPGSVGESREAKVICAIAATVINTKSTMSMIKVGLRIAGG